MTTSFVTSPSHLSSQCPVKNVSSIERAGSILGGLGLLGAGFHRRSFLTPFLLLLGGGLIYRGASGHCALYQKLAGNSKPEASAQPAPTEMGISVEQGIEIDRNPAEVFAFWRRLENLPKFMPHLESVVEDDNGISHWVANGPVGNTIRWNAVILSEDVGEQITWQSLPDADVPSVGTVRFEPMVEAGRTSVKVLLKYLPPGGPMGTLAAHIFGRVPEEQLASNLLQLKNLLEHENRAPREQVSSTANTSPDSVTDSPV